ncbi:15123_t:CDS:2 [Dentiscutata erythropus]|uniref:15123_t:CDS:1 n=1 Tax=Dentiscutata erythropus TaxID=1348616 RepID=A0A9N9NGB8_9GLOM|nr:15123_t:CDS:2 [Dentiscutata erythropus]
MDNSIIDLVVGTGISFNILDNPLFHNMVKKLHSVADSYKISHSTTVLRHLSGNIFSKRLEFIKNILLKTSGRFSLTCDGWHLTVHRCHYTVVTGSWISDDWQQVNIILNFEKSGQTAQAIKSVLLKTLEDYNIKEKLFGLTMDNTTTNKAVSRILQAELPYTNIVSIGCMCHILNLIVKVGLTGINHLQKKIHKIMKYLANPLSNSRLELLESYCPINEMCANKSLTLPCLSQEELINLKSVCQLLKPFESATYKFEHLKATLIEVGGYSDSDAKQFIDNIRQKVILYGRKYINIQSPPTTNSINESPPTTNIINELLPTTQVNDNNSASNLLFPPRRISRKYNANTIKYELELYEKDPPEEGNNSVLIWNSLSKKFPILNRMARDYFSIQPSSVTSERAFLRAGFTITNDRANLSEKTVASTILMHSWLLESQNEFSPLNALPEL